MWSQVLLSAGYRSGVGRCAPRLSSTAAGQRCSAVLIWNKRIYQCREAQRSTCEWTERRDVIAPRASLAERAGAGMRRRVGMDGDSVAAVG
jgi:hypothetical protein